MLTTTLLLKDFPVNRFFQLLYPITLRGPSNCAGLGRCAGAARVKRRKADRDDNNDRQWLDCRPTLRTLLLPNSRELPRIHQNGDRHGKKEGGWRERVRPPNCVIAFVRAAESSTGWESADHRSNTAAVAKELQQRR